ncbi:hypothetical protein OBBRIDRAFT_107675 [Obba rivulosa]|uniref:Uncharacterized protein n=1 Tax=Obba rivulosa TaxID=1052685 RepID=A0A8E2APU8_9APHY|nr:hypothetical protein OBBRIDRAFT_107675 [Obba rivulosa]
MSAPGLDLPEPVGMSESGQLDAWPSVGGSWEGNLLLYSDMTNYNTTYEFTNFNTTEACTVMTGNRELLVDADNVSDFSEGLFGFPVPELSPCCLSDTHATQSTSESEIASDTTTACSPSIWSDCSMPPFDVMWSNGEFTSPRAREDVFLASSSPGGDFIALSLHSTRPWSEMGSPEQRTLDSPANLADISVANNRTPIDNQNVEQAQQGSSQSYTVYPDIVPVYNDIYSPLTPELSHCIQVQQHEPLMDFTGTSPGELLCDKRSERRIDVSSRSRHTIGCVTWFRYVVPAARPPGINDNGTCS